MNTGRVILLDEQTVQEADIMSRTLRYVIAGASVATGYAVVRMQRQLNRVMEQAFRLELQDLP